MTYAGSADPGQADKELLAACLAIALEAGAVLLCAFGHAQHYRTFDNKAEVRAFGQATLAQSTGDLAAFPLGQVIGELARLLDDLGGACADCRDL